MQSTHAYAYAYAYALYLCPMPMLYAYVYPCAYLQHTIDSRAVLRCAERNQAVLSFAAE